MLSSKKGVDLLIEAYQEFTPGSLPSLRIIGTAAPGEERYNEQCKQSVKPEFLQYISFTGMIQEEEKGTCFSQLSLMILPYRYISQSGVLSEACMHRVPYLASDLPYFRDFNMSFGSGKLFKTNDKVSLKESLRSLSENPISITDREFSILQKELSIECCADAFCKLISK